MSRDGWKIIGRGKNGWHADNDDTSITGGYGENDGDRYALDAVDGALVYDAKHADPDAFARLVISGPILRTSLGPDEVDKFGQKDREAALRMAPALEGGFRTYAMAAQNEKFSGLDAVGVNVYERLLRKVSGIRFGRVHDGKIQWEDDHGPKLKS